MIIRFTYLASALSLAAASKSAKTPGTPRPTDAAKASKSNTPIAPNEYFLAPFSCPKECISAQGYEAESHLLEDAVVECDVNDSYQKWKVHKVGGLLKFESAAQHYHDMCLAVVHQDPDHISNRLEWVGYSDEQGFVWLDGTNLDHGVLAVGYGQADPINFLGSARLPVDLSTENEVDEYGRKISLGQWIDFNTDGTFIQNQILLSESEVDGMCSGKLGLADCDHPGSYWYNTGGNLLSALCWDQGTPTAMSVDETCTGMNVLNTTMTGDLTTSETFMILGSN